GYHSVVDGVVPNNPTPPVMVMESHGPPDTVPFESRKEASLESVRCQSLLASEKRDIGSALQ
ncbi:hypothetical protein NDU88_001021, partial [Pleurodeles waltl]